MQTLQSHKFTLDAGMDKYSWMLSDTTYDADRELLRYWKEEGYTTEDPCKADIFYVPAFTADFCQVCIACSLQ